MEQIPTQDFDFAFEFDADPGTDEDELVWAWREEQLVRLGLIPALARAFADVVDWHDMAALVRHGCPPQLALEIVR
jgi:hypothetical protein